MIRHRIVHAIATLLPFAALACGAAPELEGTDDTRSALDGTRDAPAGECAAWACNNRIEISGPVSLGAPMMSAYVELCQGAICDQRLVGVAGSESQACGTGAAAGPTACLTETGTPGVVHLDATLDAMAQGDVLIRISDPTTEEVLWESTQTPEFFTTRADACQSCWVGDATWE